MSARHWGIRRAFGVQRHGSRSDDSHLGAGQLVQDCVPVSHHIRRQRLRVGSGGWRLMRLLRLRKCLIRGWLLRVCQLLVLLVLLGLLLRRHGGQCAEEGVMIEGRSLTISQEAVFRVVLRYGTSTALSMNAGLTFKDSKSVPSMAPDQAVLFATHRNCTSATVSCMWKHALAEDA